MHFLNEAFWFLVSGIPARQEICSGVERTHYSSTFQEERNQKDHSTLPVITQDIFIMGIACSCFLGQLPDAFLMVFIVPVTPGQPDLLLRELNTQVFVSLGHLLHRSQSENQRRN